MAETEEAQIRFLRIAAGVTLVDHLVVWDIEQSLSRKDDQSQVYNVIRWPEGSLELDYVYEGRLYRVYISTNGQYSAWLYPKNYPIPSPVQLSNGADRRIEMDL